MDDVAREAGVTRLIVYRHFASKGELYRAVLERVSLRLAEELDSTRRDPSSGTVIGALLAVAREDPDGFRLLWVHAQREDAFAAYAAEFRRGAVAFAELMLAGRAPVDGALHTWAVTYMVNASIDAVLGWLDDGDPADDERFVELTRRGLAAMIASWSTSGPQRAVQPPSTARV